MRGTTDGEWNEGCTAGAIRHVVRNVDHDAYCGDETDHESFGKYDGGYIAALHNAYPQLRAYIAELEARPQGIGDGDIAHALKVAEAGRVLAEAVSGIYPDDGGSEYNAAMDAALTTFRTSTQDLISK